MKKLGPNAHAVLDYISLPPYFLLPKLFGWSTWTTVCTLPVGIFHTLLTVLTDYPMGLVKLLSYKKHGVIEYTSVIHLVAWPYIMRFPERTARGFYVFAGLFLLAVCLITDYNALGEPERADAVTS